MDSKEYNTDTPEDVREILQKILVKQNEHFTEIMLEMKNISERQPEKECICGNNFDDEEMYEKAKEIVIKNQKASTSLLQRKLKIGYSYASHLIDELEDDEIIAPADGVKPRKVLVQE